MLLNDLPELFVKLLSAEQVHPQSRRHHAVNIDLRSIGGEPACGKRDVEDAVQKTYAGNVIDKRNGRALRVSQWNVGIVNHEASLFRRGRKVLDRLSVFLLYLYDPCIKDFVT